MWHLYISLRRPGGGGSLGYVRITNTQRAPPESGPDEREDGGGELGINKTKGPGERCGYSLEWRGEERGGERVRGEMEKVFGGAVLFFWLCCYTHNTKGGEGRQLSTSFRFQQLSLGLHHAGRVCVRGLQEGDELVGVLIGFLGPRLDCKIFLKPINSITFVLFDKYYPIVDQLDSKDSSRDFQLNCVINYFLPIFNTLCMCLNI